MKANFFDRLFKKVYAWNISSFEIHNLNGKNCFTLYNAKRRNFRFIRKKRALRLMEKHNEVNGCRFCWPEKNTG